MMSNIIILTDQQTGQSAYSTEVSSSPRLQETTMPSYPRKKSLSSPSTSRSAVLLVFLFLTATSAFSIIRQGQHQRTSNTRLCSIFDDDDDAKGDDNSSPKKGVVNFDTFNPLNYKASRSNAAYGYSGTQISLRKTTMTEMTDQLINVVGDETATNDILMDYKDFLLETLDDMEAVLDPDSIYTPQMSRTDRYQAYRASIDERVESAKNPQVISVLKAMKAFVVSFE